MESEATQVKNIKTFHSDSIFSVFEVTAATNPYFCVCCGGISYIEVIYYEQFLLMSCTKA